MELLVWFIRWLLSDKDGGADVRRRQWEEQQAYERLRLWHEQQRLAQEAADQQGWQGQYGGASAPPPGGPTTMSVGAGSRRRRQRRANAGVPPPLSAAVPQPAAPSNDPAAAPVSPFDSPYGERATAPAAAPAADAPALAGWMRPTTLRSQFILTEILRAPVALRPPRE